MTVVAISNVMHVPLRAASAFAALAGVPPVGQRLAACHWAGGTPYPLRSRGSEFNELAPQVPEGLGAPRFAASHQHRRPRGPPMLKGMAHHGLPCGAPPKANHGGDFLSGVQCKRGTMKPNRIEYARRLSVQVTAAMDARLEQIARSRDEAKAEVVRAALRAFLDQQEDVIGSRKHFTKAFGQRIDRVEQFLSIILALNLKTQHMLSERLQQREIEMGKLLDHAVKEGVNSHEVMNEYIDVTVARRKAKPPAR